LDPAIIALGTTTSAVMAVLGRTPGKKKRDGRRAWKLPPKEDGGVHRSAKLQYIISFLFTVSLVNPFVMISSPVRTPD
jgi:hypothetical protein